VSVGLYFEVDVSAVIISCREVSTVYLEETERNGQAIGGLVTQPTARDLACSADHLVGRNRQLSGAEAHQTPC
jgi:hypothetical protein